MCAAKDPISQGLKLCTLCDVAVGIKTIMPAWVGLTGEAPSLASRSRDTINLPLNGWPGEVERDRLPLDPAEDYSAGLFGHDLKEFHLEH